MLGRIVEMPAQCLIAWDRIMDFDLPAAYERAREVVVLGMGGSAQGGDLLRTLAADECQVPLLVNRQYTVPGFVDERTLVIGSSYSGNTEETLAAFQSALDLGAMGLAIAKGGKLAAVAEARDVPFYRIRYETVPRAALAHTFVPLLGVFQQLGFIRRQGDGLAEATAVMEQWQAEIGSQVPLEENPAKQLAQRLFGKLPVVYGAGMLGVVARRWKAQLNENSKSWAFFEEMPELNHNAVMGTRLPFVFPPHALVVMLTSESDHARNRLRFQVTRELLEAEGVAAHEVEARGESRLAQMLSSIHFGDFVSFYLAMLNGANPTDTGAIERLKAQMAQHD
jgi:glucose/mannose-6-phosphate isomerase